MKKISIYQYSDYRDFLRDWFKNKKSLSPSRNSLRNISKKWELTPSYLSMVISGNRVLTDKGIKKIAEGMKLNETETKFFSLLVGLQRAKNSRERDLVLTEINKFQVYKKMNPKEIVTHQYLSNWYNVVIREMTNLSDFKLDPIWIRNKLNNKVPLNKITEAIEFLVSNGFIKINEQGDILPPEIVLECKDRIYSLSLSSFHQQMFDVTVDSFENVSRDDRSISGQTFSLDSKNFNKAKKILAHARDEIRKLYENQSQSDIVYHVSISMCPLTKKETGNDKE